MALVTSVVYIHDSEVAGRLTATTLAVVTAVNPTGYLYRYDNDRCTGGGAQRPPPILGTQLRIYYDPNHRCDNLPDDPVKRVRSDLIELVAFSVVFSIIVSSAGWDAARSR